MGRSTTQTAYNKTNLIWPMSWSKDGLTGAALARRYESAIRHLMRTPQGAFLTDPEYGSTYYRLRTQNMTRASIDTAYAQFKMAAAKYIPDIIVHRQDVNMNQDTHEVEIMITWTIRGATAKAHGDLGLPKKTTVTL